jgi:hypothetical protein
LGQPHSIIGQRQRGDKNKDRQQEYPGNLHIYYFNGTKLNDLGQLLFDLYRVFQLPFYNYFFTIACEKISKAVNNPVWNVNMKLHFWKEKQKQAPVTAVLVYYLPFIPLPSTSGAARNLFNNNFPVFPHHR